MPGTSGTLLGPLRTTAASARHGSRHRVTRRLASWSRLVLPNDGPQYWKLYYWKVVGVVQERAAREGPCSGSRRVGWRSVRRGRRGLYFGMRFPGLGRSLAPPTPSVSPHPLAKGTRPAIIGVVLTHHRRKPVSLVDGSSVRVHEVLYECSSGYFYSHSYVWDCGWYCMRGSEREE